MDSTNENLTGLPILAAVPRSEEQIVAQTNALAHLCLSHLGTGYEAPLSHLFYKADDTRSRAAWAHACEIMVLLTATDPNDALSSLDEDYAPEGAFEGGPGIYYTWKHPTEGEEHRQFGPKHPGFPEDSPYVVERLVVQKGSGQ